MGSSITLGWPGWKLGISWQFPRMGRQGITDTQLQALHFGSLEIFPALFFFSQYSGARLSLQSCPEHPADVPAATRHLELPLVRPRLPVYVPGWAQLHFRFRTSLRTAWNEDSLKLPSDADGPLCARKTDVCNSSKSAWKHPKAWVKWGNFERHQTKGAVI